MDPLRRVAWEGVGDVGGDDHAAVFVQGAHLGGALPAGGTGDHDHAVLGAAGHHNSGRGFRDSMIIGRALTAKFAADSLSESVFGI